MSGEVWVAPGVFSQSNSGSASTDIRVLNQGAVPTNAIFDLLPVGSATAPASVTQSILPEYPTIGPETKLKTPPHIAIRVSVIRTALQELQPDIVMLARIGHSCSIE